ncbi:MAG: hypothetical protein KKA07_06620, partial [Bacteroidetes bacterium]|nr:hypothetical protein [Bacteroidota bacterium]MBU1718730.1 hypothetical protein [Bacteroidota bacterium]
MSYINGLSGIDTLGALPGCLSQKINSNKAVLEKALERGKLNGLGFTQNVVPFSQVVELYNAGISKDEIKAWVWYRRKHGVPMNGWNEFYLNGNVDAE